MFELIFIQNNLFSILNNFIEQIVLLYFDFQLFFVEIKNLDWGK
jgi:hypothetical protein